MWHPSLNLEHELGTPGILLSLDTNLGSAPLLGSVFTATDQSTRSG